MSPTAHLETTRLVSSLVRAAARAYGMAYGHAAARGRARIRVYAYRIQRRILETRMRIP